MERSGSFRRILGMGSPNSQEDEEQLTHQGGAPFTRKRSMIRPERQRLNKDDPQYYYTLASEESNLNVHPSSTGNDPHLIANNLEREIYLEEQSEAYNGDLDSALLGRADSRGFNKGSNIKGFSKVSITNPLSRNNSKSYQYSKVSEEPISNGEDEDQLANAVRVDRSNSLFGPTEHTETNTKESERPVLDPQAADTGPDIPVESQLQPELSFDDESRPFIKPLMPKENNFNPWLVYCKFITFPITPMILRWFGLKTKERQMAWREKIGLITCILYCGVAVGFLTFGFTQTVCSSTSLRVPYTDISSNYLVISGKVYDLGDYRHPAVSGIDADSPILYPPINAGGTDASFLFQNVNGNCLNVIKPRENSTIPHNSMNQMGWYFPCELLGYDNNTLISNDNLVSKGTDLYNGWGCHTYNSARKALFDKQPSATLYYTWDQLAEDSSKNLITYNGDVMDLSRLDHLLKDQLTYPEIIDSLRADAALMGHDISQDFSYGYNRKVMNCLREITKVGEIDSEPIGCIASKVVLYISLVFIMGLVVVKFLVACYFRFFIARRQGAYPISEAEFHNRENKIEDWGDDIYSPASRYKPVYPVDDNAITSSYTNVSSNISESLNTDIGTPHMSDSVYGNMFSSSDQGKSSESSIKPEDLSLKSKNNTNNSAKKRRSVFMERLTTNPKESSHVSGVTMSTQNPELTSSKVSSGQSLQNYPLHRQSLYGKFDNESSAYLVETRSHGFDDTSSYQGIENEYIKLDDLQPSSVYSNGEMISHKRTPYSIGSEGFNGSPSTVPLGFNGSSNDYIVNQPPVEFQPFGYPLAHVMCMVTAYSESVEGLRTTLDSICTTDYPNSHKLIMIVCDGLIKGSGNDMTTPEICLSMMKDFSEPVETQQAHSYVSVVSGEKRHNMAKVYAGFYKYDNDTVPLEKQQRVPVICIVKCGTPKEANAAKPGNRGKRDSQVILMSFLQHVMFDERMTELDFQIFNGIRSITGIAPDYYEMMLMVDADTKVYPDCLTHMVAEMVKDPEVMGLCGETKIANKRQSWVTMIQVFEYFISHHQAKGFESVFGGVSCLPGCFSMYRIKSPKGAEGYWVPILCNPDIVERYSDNVIDTLHKKNLLLLGEDRYLSTLMAKTFPKRKTIFVPKAACKTVVPDEFKVLLSQRRRWINSTIHNLFELVLVRNSCGVFVISMQFVVFIDLISTLVLPAAIAFTLYVVIIAIVKKPTPTLSLILLAMILGLPGLLIVVTATRASYLLWMLIYILALPIWNFVLPMYAYWKFDDFSWGNTREIVGGDKGHEEANGEFDSSKIIMKRWKEFQQDLQKL